MAPPSSPPKAEPAIIPMNNSFVAFLKKHVVTLLLALGVGTYILIAGTTGSCAACSAITRTLGLPSLASTATDSEVAPFAPGGSQSRAPAWELPDLDGRAVKSGDFAGKVVILDFWATWCPPCRAEIPHFVELQREYGEKGLMIVGVSLDEKGPAVVKPFAGKFGINYPLVMGDQRIVEAFGGIEGIPTTFVIDRQGNIVKRHVGYGSKAEFESAIKPLL